MPTPTGLATAACGGAPVGVTAASSPIISSSDCAADGLSASKRCSRFRLSPTDCPTTTIGTAVCFVSEMSKQVGVVTMAGGTMGIATLAIGTGAGATTAIGLCCIAVALAPDWGRNWSRYATNCWRMSCTSGVSLVKLCTPAMRSATTCLAYCVPSLVGCWCCWLESGSDLASRALERSAASSVERAERAAIVAANSWMSDPVASALPWSTAS